MTKTVAFLSMEDLSGYFVSDQLAIGPLEKLGWDVKTIPWDRGGVDWSEFRAVVIRSTWDYQNRPEQFLDVLAEIEASDTHLLNPLSICRWNLDKRYLLELHGKQVEIVPTRLVDAPVDSDIKAAFDRWGTDTVVVKPIVGANADDAFVLERLDGAAWGSAIKTYNNRKALMQPFIETIRTVGEYSLFYFNGELSHAIIKRPKEGDFRVQEEHGGRIQGIEPNETLKASARKVLDAIAQTLLYARVDLVQLPTGGYGLMELELIEPSLYFDSDPESAERFANALDSLF